MPFTFKNVQNAGAAATSVSSPNLGAVAIGDLVCAIRYAPNAAGTVTTDNVGNTYSNLFSRNNGSTGGVQFWYTFVTVASAGLIVSFSGSTTTPSQGIFWVVSGANAYNGDQANQANFAASTAWSVGPTAPAPAANSLFIYGLSLDTAQASFTEVTGYNVTGANGFTVAMSTASKQLTSSASTAVLCSGYIISSAAQTATTTLATAAQSFSVIASFAPYVPSPTGNTKYATNFKGWKRYSYNHFPY